MLALSFCKLSSSLIDIKMHKVGFFTYQVSILNNYYKKQLLNQGMDVVN